MAKERIVAARAGKTDEDRETDRRKAKERMSSIRVRKTEEEKKVERREARAIKAEITEENKRKENIRDEERMMNSIYDNDIVKQMNEENRLHKEEK